ncbi:uncharacterized protein LOC111718193 isoform X3 [Eurytemora carolleeae]|uniref:uncharacterized protein LOC111718193 isoform X3 n=1 Tax=Eurytemora carolleeae TaxID=1294199 RepID=UPI000C77A117|nr:uncharacterized protein LOC111718193 isoform X3 [Eurytemora carolleeae]|eukprot:XP_023349490.1 uncharacterized protein LOC111718193 isoform X3 [Eurytemora affinis]
MGRDEMDDRKRALIFGKFKFLYQDETEELESLDKFQLAIIQNKLLGPVQYKNKDGKSEEILEIYGQEKKPGDGFSDPPITIPGVLDLFTVVWSNPYGDITVDQDIKLFEFTDIQKYSTYNDGPKAKGFCQFHSSSSSKDLDGFDSSIFWSAGLLYKHFRTCGVEQWDIEFKELYTHYRNWKEWHHEVHNLPNKNNDKSGKFSNNKFSGPEFISSNYTRSRDRPRSKKNNSSPARSSLVNDPTKPQKHYPKTSPSAPLPTTPMSVPPPVLPYTPMTTPPPVLAIPPPGQTLTLPMMGPNGTTIQVQLMSLPSVAPPTPQTPEPTPRFNYINPNFSAGAPPQDAKWSSAVDNFLHPKASTDSSTSVKNRTRELVPCHTSSPKKKSRSEERADMLADLKAIQKKRKAEETKGRNSKKFKPKTQIMAPSTAGSGSTEEDVNTLDLLPEDKLYIGVIKDWRGKFGFLKCSDIQGKIFLHSKDIKSGLELVGEAQKATFQVLHYEKSAVGAKAVNVIILGK